MCAQPNGVRCGDGLFVGGTGFSANPDEVLKNAVRCSSDSVRYDVEVLPGQLFVVAPTSAGDVARMRFALYRLVERPGGDSAPASHFVRYARYATSAGGSTEIVKRGVFVESRPGESEETLLRRIDAEARRRVEAGGKTYQFVCYANTPHLFPTGRIGCGDEPVLAAPAPDACLNEPWDQPHSCGESSLGDHR